MGADRTLEFQIETSSHITPSVRLGRKVAGAAPSQLSQPASLAGLQLRHVRLQDERRQASLRARASERDLDDGRRAVEACELPRDAHRLLEVSAVACEENEAPAARCVRLHGRSATAGAVQVEAAGRATAGVPTSARQEFSPDTKYALRRLGVHRPDGKNTHAVC